MFAFTKSRTPHSRNDTYRLDFNSLIVLPDSILGPHKCEALYQELVTERDRVTLPRQDFKELLKRAFITQRSVTAVLHKHLRRRECYCCYDTPSRQVAVRAGSALNILKTSFQLEAHVRSAEFREQIRAYTRPFMGCERGEHEAIRKHLRPPTPLLAAVIKALNALPGMLVAYVVDGPTVLLREHGRPVSPRVSLYRSEKTLQFLDFVESFITQHRDHLAIRVTCLRNTLPRLGLVYYRPQCQIILAARPGGPATLETMFWQFVLDRANAALALVPKK